MKFTKKQIRQILSEGWRPQGWQDVPGEIRDVSGAVWKALAGYVGEDDLIKVVDQMKRLKTVENWKIFVKYYKALYKKDPAKVIQNVGTASLSLRAGRLKRKAYALASGKGYAAAPAPTATTGAACPEGSFPQEFAGGYKCITPDGKVVKDTTKPASGYGEPAQQATKAPLRATGQPQVQQCPDGTVAIGQPDGTILCTPAGQTEREPPPVVKKPRGKASASRRARRNKPYKHRLAGKIQALLVKAMGGAVQESRLLTEAKNPCTGARAASGVDSWMGDTTVKCLKTVPILKNQPEMVKDIRSVFKNMKKILQLLNSCKGKPACKPAAAAAAPTGTAGLSSFAGRDLRTRIVRYAKKEMLYKDEQDSKMKKRIENIIFTKIVPQVEKEVAEKKLKATPTALQVRVAALAQPHVRSLKPGKTETAPGEVGEKGDTRAGYDKCSALPGCKGGCLIGCSAYFAKHRKLPPKGTTFDQYGTITLPESKSPLKPIRIKHFDDRNKKLFEHLIAKVTKND